MMNDEYLKEILHMKNISRSDKSLVALYAKGPCSVKEIVETLVNAGIRDAKNWNISSMLARTKGKAVRTKSGWDLRQDGKNYLNKIGVTDINFLANPDPSIFKIPKGEKKENLVSVMMPFGTEFDDVYNSLKSACHAIRMECLRVDDIWEESAIIQDIFGLIFRSKIVICDLTNRNPNVFYETGIAHTLGRKVIPIVQNSNDVPFDMRHHRHIEYKNSSDGLDYLKIKISSRIKKIMQEKS